ncbi:MAG: DUF1015 domain-containing protein [Allobaculum sp.]|nr:DUF1015 domain-containing protein [Allobaculum sp.]
MKKGFLAANILLPKLENLQDWAVVACDQYSSDPEYWNTVYERVKDNPSTLHLILPEAWLNSEKEEQHKQKIRQNMQDYLHRKLLREYPDSYIYVERTLSNGTIRQGLIGALDLEEYDYHCPSNSSIRATEATILERIPPRARIRKEAILEFPHILLLQNDLQDRLFQQLQAIRLELPVLYEFDLMENGGHIIGRLCQGETKELIDKWLEEYEEDPTGDGTQTNLLYAVGDGNHSLAAAKAIWNRLKEQIDPALHAIHPARYALAELENLHSEAQQFEPIHRILKDVDVEALLASFPNVNSEEGYAIDWVSQENRGTIYLDPTVSPLPLAVLQKHLDAWLAQNPGTIDYIHGEKELEGLAQKPNSIGFFLPAIEKESLFETITKDGSLPRKTFSMGHAHEKRYYLEGKSLILKEK